ncbi:hypothetical protein [Tenacibaculum sp. SDUM215027]|uniref:hypothetical protein n=1 Tax=Tenacibaculum sp. SDUM215027 TaxID=3422596 RepID=UPI003D31958A
MAIRITLSIIVLLCFGCKGNHSEVQIDFIVKKRVLYNNKAITTAAMHHYQDNFYAIKEEFLFNSYGELERIGVNKGEGLFYFYKNDNKSLFSLSKNYPEYKDYKVVYNLKEKNVIDGNDTILNFKIDYIKKNISYTKNKEIVIYSFLEK